MRTFIMIALVLVGAGTVSAQQPAAYNFSSPVQAYPAGYAPQPMAPTMQPGMTPTTVAPQPAYFNNAAGCDASGCDASGNVWNGGRRFGLGNGFGNRFGNGFGNGGCDSGNCGGVGCDNGNCGNGNCGGGAGCDGGNCGGGIGGGRGLFGGLLGMGWFNNCCGVGGASGRGVYHNLFGGFSESNNMNLESMNNPGLNPDLDMKNGWLVGRAWGHQVNCNWRTEIETSYRNNSVSDLEVGGVGGVDLPGRLNVFSGMVNIVRDFRPMGRDGSIRPYVGVGGGVAFVDFEAHAVGPVTGFLDSRDSTFAYQGFVGVSRKIRNCVDLYTEYRFFGLNDFCIKNFDAGNDFADMLQGNLTQHNFLFGMRVWVR